MKLSSPSRMLTRPHQIFLPTSSTALLSAFSTHADDCVVTVQVDGNKILLRDRNICCKMHAQVSFLLAQKKWKFYETWLGYVASVAWPFFFGDFRQLANSQIVSMPRNSRPFPSLKSEMSFGERARKPVVLVDNPEATEVGGLLCLDKKLCAETSTFWN